LAMFSRSNVKWPERTFTSLTTTVSCACCADRVWWSGRG
jgi:hypothetical protein